METVVMFSFIGCGGCEYAMREMKAEKFQFRTGLRFCYSSPTDSGTALKNYLHKKAFPFPAFSKESGMNEDFSAYFFPTFVLIGEDGVVKKVLMGYDAEVAALLFGSSRD